MSSEDAAPSTPPAQVIDARRGERRHLRAVPWLFWRGLLGQVGPVLADLPVFVTAPLYRRWHLRWGSTNDEVSSAMPGDARLPNAQFVSTRSITIDADPAAVWPWLVQVGCGRAGFYSNDPLDNLGRPSARAIVDDLQHRGAGQWIPKTAFRVGSFEAAP